MGEETASVVVFCRDLFGAGIKSIFARECGSFKIHVLPRCEEARRVTAPAAVRLVMLDVDIVGRDRLRRTIGKLRELFPSAGIMVATASGGRNEILEFCAWGAHGVMFKHQSAKDIARAIKVVMNGGVSIPSVGGRSDIEVSRGLDRPVTEARSSADAMPPRSAESLPEDFGGVRLSPRQHDVLKLLVLGLSNKAIARELGLSEATVKVHNNAVFKALNVHNRASAVARILSGEFRRRDEDEVATRHAAMASGARYASVASSGERRDRAG